MRGVSTVVDATLFLLILGVAVTTLVGVPMVLGESPTDHADAAAEGLATGTARVDYSLAPAARAVPGSPPIEIREGPHFSRSAHGTVASLLADATVATVAVDGERISRVGEAYEAAVVDATESRIRSENHTVGVRAVWQPYPDAPIRGQVRAGRRPPATADVNAATVTVDVSVPAGRRTAIAAARTEGFDGVARAVADATVAGLFPPEGTQLALRGDYPVDALVANRYRLTTATLGETSGVPTGDTDIAAANDELAATLAERLESDLRRRFATPAAAARNVSTGTAAVTVRTWSR